MDRKSITGLLLIAAIVVVFSIFNMPSQEDIDAENRYNDSVARVERIKDSIANREKKIARENTNPADSVKQTLVKAGIDTSKNLTKTDSVKIDSIQKTQADRLLSDKYGIFSNAAMAQSDCKDVVLENELLRVVIHCKGGGIASAELKKYRSYASYRDGKNIPLKLFDGDSSKMVLTFSADSKRLRTEDYYFTPTVEGNSKATLALTSNDGKQKLEIVYSLKKGSYNVDYTVRNTGPKTDEMNGQMEMEWLMKPLLTEKLAQSERQVSSIFYKYVDESRSYLSEFSDDEKNLEAQTQWIAFKTAYFSSVVLSPKGFKKDGGKIEVKNIVSNVYSKQYNAYLNVSPLRGEKDISPFKFYFGPNDYEVLVDQGYEMENIINLGWGIFGWVNKWLVIPVFEMLDAMNLNYGIIIFLLTLIVKIIILPLTYRNYKSSAKMRVLKPEIAEINKKYGSEEPMKKQQATMALYRQSGVSPMAGCIPVLIQMPVLIAVFRFFPSAIQLRQQNFLWADDLSAYDSIVDFGANIPFYGDHMSLFTILMCGSTILFTYVNSQQMDQSSAMPGMKFMMYFFPVMMLFFFNSMAAGLSYYYFVSNILSIVIMWLVKKYFIDENKIRAAIEAYKKRPDANKKSKFQQRLEEVQKQRAEQLKNRKK
ncbi:MAG TPA: membrane protein insertase YidC [Flavobacteriales bacterium]|nr:membrane protein insertase YidC [Flavobacteriales bacterium]